MKKVSLYTDGSARGNPGPGGFGAILLYNHHRNELSGGFACTTNNRMELLAAITGLESLTSPCHVTVHSDSKYLVDAMTKGWIDKWRRLGWRRSPKPADTLKNPDLWQRLDAATTRHQVDWQWIKGHAGHEENERADELATTAADQKNLPPDKGYESSQTLPPEETIPLL